MEHANHQKISLSLTQAEVVGLTGEITELAVVYKHYIILFGSRISISSQDCAIFDTQKKTASYISTFLEPSRRHNSSICHWKDNIFVFYSTERSMGLQAMSEPRPLTYEIILLYVVETEDTVTIKPEYINTSHSQYSIHGNHYVQIHENNLYVLADGMNSGMMELWRFSLDQRQWGKCEVTGEVPKQGMQEGRRLGSVTFGDKIYVFFGRGKHKEGVMFQNCYDLYAVDMENMRWERVHESFLEIIQEDHYVGYQGPGLANPNMHQMLANPRVQSIMIQKMEGIASQRLQALKTEVVGQNIYIYSANWKEFIIYNPKNKTLEKIGEASPQEGWMIKSHQHQPILFRIKKDSEQINPVKVFIEFQNLDEAVDNETPNFSSGVSYMKFLWEEKAFADITFIVQGEEILAHRAILGKSRYFMNMFQSGMMEASSARIDVPGDVSVGNFKAILEYIYCEKVALTETLALDLVVLADMYFLEKLKADCEDYLSKNLSVESFLRVMNVAETADSKKLKEKVLSFLVGNIEKIMAEVDVEKIPTEILMKGILYAKQKKM